MAVLTLEKSRFRSVQLDITDVIVKKKKKTLNKKIKSVHIYTYITWKQNKPIRRRNIPGSGYIHYV